MQLPPLNDSAYARLSPWLIGSLLSLSVINAALNTLSVLLSAVISAYQKANCSGVDEQVLYSWLQLFV